MIYFIFGEDSYRSKEKLQEIILGYKEKHKSGLNLLYIDAKEKKFSDFYCNFKINSMFDEKKLIILSNVFSAKDFQEDFLENVETMENLKDIVVVYENEKVDERTKLFKSLQKKVKSQEFNFLQPVMLKKWVLQKFENNKVKIDFDALDLLVEFVKNNPWRMVNEINKLSNYKKNSVIKKEDILLQIKPSIENDIFKTIDALASKNKKQALSLLHKHLENGDNALYLLTMIAYQFRNLLIVKELSDKGIPYPTLVKSSGLNPFVVRKISYLCNDFSMQELKKIYQKIFQADADIKTGKVDAETSLDLLLAEI